MEKIGRYEVVRTLGRGGMGEVYLGRDPKLERQVALKVLNRDDGADSRGLFEREAKALAALSHPNIVTIFEIADVDGRQFIAMEYLPGRSLRELLLHDRPSRDAIVTICAQVATALAAAHETGILHRDIKPENVVVGKGNAVKVVDFGIARRLDAMSLDPGGQRRGENTGTIEARAEQIVDVFTRTIRVDAVGALPTARATTQETEPPTFDSATRTVFGTPAYMAPEVLTGEATSIASDVYSLGIMLHECLVGRRPYDAPNLHEVIARVIDGSEEPIRIDDPLAPLVARMIERDPTKRPALAEVIKALSRRHSTIARPVPAPKRRWVLPFAVAAIVGIAVAGVAVWWKGGTAPDSGTIDRGAIAIRDLEVVTIPSYGNAADPEAFARTLAKLVGAARVEVVPPELLRDKTATTAPVDWKKAAENRNARLLASGRIVESDGKLVARFEIIDLVTKGVVTTEVTGSPDRVADMMLELADWIVGVVRPGHRFDRAPNRALAIELVRIGVVHMREAEANKARTFFEQAVTADPTSAEAWDRYAASLAMMAARRETVIKAAERAFTLAPEGPRKRILHGTLLVYRSEFADALIELAPLEDAGLKGDDLRDLMFLIGECHWHEGRHDRGFDYFKRTLELDVTFAEAASHAGEYGIVRRNEAIAREYTRVQRWPLEQVQFALGDYEALAKSGKEPYDAWAKIVLGIPVDRSKSPFVSHPMIYDRITAAAAKGDRLEVKRELDTLLTQIEPFTGLTAALLAQMGEVLLVAEMPEDAKRILDVLRVKQPLYQFKRLSILAGPMLGATKFERKVLTERLATLASAIDAELAGDRETAAKLLAELVGNPTHEWDFVERFALIRNLRALGKTKEADAVCADTMRPPVIRYVFHVARARCVR